MCFGGDSSDPGAFSGSPAGLTAALERAGHSVLRVNTALPSALERIAGRARWLHPELCRVHTYIADARLSKLEYDAVVQIGTDFLVCTAAPTVTYDDMTVAQHVRLRDDWFARYPRRAQLAWQVRQMRAFTNADRCCVLSQWAAESVVQDYQQPAEKVCVIGLGGNHIIEAPADRDWSKPRYLIIAKNWRRKNVPLVVETFAEVKRRFPSASLDVVGPYIGGPQPGVVFHGSLDLNKLSDRRRVEELLRSATCYVMPSKHEASALAFVEAGAAGIPSIGTTSGGVRELIGPGGTVVDPTDSFSLLREMIRLADPRTASTLGALAADHARWYTWDATAQRLLNVIEEVARGRGRSSNECSTS
ncbi:D-inositol 3-phosphate glycosyltransferase [Mycolicibacterium chlorophenolicum]|uniref:D-inositol 3-phosphate glycosyltransferase n=2 Tax=Mycolicibacterium chlorophenolicum TaxID=37916 RepID=A0A0J6YE99_9MYCO|nr:D-inositol 3-phosphate glycosyltransferase [Mycolicibacterium chlorophenolicum]